MLALVLDVETVVEVEEVEEVERVVELGGTGPDSTMVGGRLSKSIFFAR